MNLLNFTELYLELEEFLPNKIRIQQCFEEKYLTFYIDWVDNNGVMKNIGCSFPYSDVIKFKGNWIKRICNLIKKEIKDDL